MNKRLPGIVCWILLAATLATGCLSRSRLNVRCEWVDDPSTPLNLQQATGQRHLVDDVELAEELGIRYGDTFRKYHGRDEEHAQASSCQQRLFKTIAQNHGVADAEVQAARLRRPAGADSLTLAAFTIVFGFAGLPLIRAVRQRMMFSGTFVRASSYGVTGVALSGVAVTGFNLVWVPLVEMVRTSNTHRSFRAAPLPWSNHTDVLFLGALLVFTGLVALSRLATTAPERRT